MHQNLHAYFTRPGRGRRNVQSPKNLMNSSPGEGDPCSSENKHDGRRAPKAKAVCVKMRLQERRLQT